jgi:hypothetical protein
MKRQASDSFSSSNQLVVKRQKSSDNLKNGSALTTLGSGKGQNGTLVQSVCFSILPVLYKTTFAEFNESRSADRSTMTRSHE